MRKKTWTEFRNTGLLWFINMILHLFGWAIVVVMDEGEIIDAYPARVGFRGFCEEDDEEGYRKVTKYLKESIDDLMKEVKDVD